MAFVCYISHACCFASQGFTSPCLRSLWLTLCQGKGQQRRSVTINPHPSHCAPSLEPKSRDFIMISSISFIYEKAKNVENGLLYFELTRRQCVQSRQLKRCCKVESASFQMQTSFCFNSPRAFFCDFFRMTHESRFAQPSKTPRNDIWCFTHIFAPLRWKSLNQVFFKSRRWYAPISHFTFLKSFFLLFFRSPTKSPINHTPKTPQKCLLCLLHISLRKKV